jgi:hypothetical protein
MPQLFDICTVKSFKMLIISGIWKVMIIDTLKKVCRVEVMEVGLLEGE